MMDAENSTRILYKTAFLSHIFAFIYVYTHILTHTHTYIYIYIYIYVHRGADKSLSRPGGNKLMFPSEWSEFLSAPFLAGKET